MRNITRFPYNITRFPFTIPFKCRFIYKAYLKGVKPEGAYPITNSFNYNTVKLDENLEYRLLAIILYSKIITIIYQSKNSLIYTYKRNNV